MPSLASDLTGGIFGGTPDYGALAARNERKRKGIIDLGMQQINAVFGGGTAPFYSLANAGGAKFDPKQTYFSLNKKGQFSPFWAPGGAHPSGTFDRNIIGDALASGGGDLGAALAVRGLGLDKLFGDEKSPREIAKQKFNRGILFNTPTNETFTGFQEPFYAAREKAYIDYALPQVAENYLQARRAQTYGLANRGLLGSSVAREARSDLERIAGTSRQQVADEAISQRNALERQVENSRQQAIAQLYQTSDPAQAFQTAISGAFQAQQPSSFAPIANTFGQLAQQYYTNQLLNNYRNFGAQLSGGLGPYTAPV